MSKILRSALLSAALCSATPARCEELLLDQASDHIITATIRGVALRLRVVLDAHGFIILNRVAALRAKLGRGDHGSIMAIGPVRLKGRGARRSVTIGGATEVLPLHWYERRIDDEADGVISPALLPYDRVRMRFASTAAGKRETTFRVQFSEGDGLHMPVGVGGAYSIAVRFSPTAPNTVAAGAAAAMMAETHGGSLAPEYSRTDIGFGVHRPARWLWLSRPVRVGGVAVQRMLMRTGDFLGRHLLPPGYVSSPDGEIVVTAAGKRQEALYRMTLGSDVLGTCGEADYRRVERELVFRCQ